MRGGARKGAGRKVGSTKTGNRKKISITLPMEMVDWLRRRDISQAKTIEKAIESYRIDRSLITLSDDDIEDIHNELVDELLDRGLLAR